MGLQKQGFGKQHLRNYLIRNYLHKSLLALGSLGFASTALLPLPVQAVDTPSSSPSGGAPSRTASGAPKRTIPSCFLASTFDLNHDGEAEALTPATVLSPEGNVTTTLDPQPTLFVYLPQTSGTQAELTVDERIPTGNADKPYDYEEVLFVDELPIPATTATGPRIVQYQIPEGVLEPDKSYIWSLSLLCKGSSISPPIATVEGLISCEVGCTATALGTEQPWNETLLATAQDRAARPEDWQRLLESQGLGCFRDVPFADEVEATFTLQDDPQCFVD
ncbi:MAG: DUF928 domain-containing protein [Spirulinaceae cyanobacterium]